MTTGRRIATLAGVVIVLLAARSFVLPSTAPAWLRGTSPFNWLETRRERQRCITFGEMMGPKGRTFANYDDDRTSPLTVAIDRTLRAGDSLVFEGHASRGRTMQILFHCATASAHGHPGEHHTELAQPWNGVAEDWASVHALEARIERECADSAAAAWPTSRISPNMLVQRPVGFHALVLGRARDTVYEAEPREFACYARANGAEVESVNLVDPPRQPAP